MSVHVYLHTYLSMCVHVSVCFCACTHICVCVRVCVCACVNQTAPAGQMIYVLVCCQGSWLSYERGDPTSKDVYPETDSVPLDPHFLFLQFLEKWYLGSGYLLLRA